MPRLRKLIFNNHVHVITFSMESGIMLPANNLTSFFFKAAMLRALRLHPIKISHILVSGTHVHMIVRVTNPSDIKGFMGRVKTESSHYINRSLGRPKHTNWCKSYDSPRLYSEQEVIDYIEYTYINPVKDRLTHSIYDYPGFSSWNLFVGTQKRIYGRVITRDSVFPVSQDIGAKGFKKVVQKLSKLPSTGKLERILIEPNDWLVSFGITDPEEIAKINDRIIKRVESYTQEESCVGRERLENQGIDLSYEPKRSGKKMWVICRDVKVRKEYISYLKRIAERAREVYREWEKGNTSLRMPLGVFAPCMPVVANLLP